jgi:hypothetical protein
LLVPGFGGILNLKLTMLLAASSLSAFGSTIFGASTTTANGSTYTVAVTDFSTTGADMAGLVITANYASGGPLTCTWLAAGSCTSGVGGFSVTYPAAESTHPQVNNSNWILTNSRSGSTLTSITVNGIPGLVAFDRCMTATNTFDDTNPGSAFNPGGNCDTNGTVGSDVGYSVGTGNTTATGGAGTSGITGTVAYQNALHLSSSSIVGDWWGQFTITFAGTAFSNGSTFTFRSDSDTLTSAVLDVSPVPEPGTFAAVGAGLVLIGILRRRKR